MRAAVLVFVVLSSACAQPNGPDPVEGDLVVERLAAEIYSGFEEAERRVVRNSLEWAAVWPRVNKVHDPVAPPAIDFSSEQVVVAALGARPSTGYSVRVTGASRTANGVTVRLETQSLGTGCGALTVMTHPIDVVKMPRTSGSVVFEETQIVKNCG